MVEGKQRNGALNHYNYLNTGENVLEMYTLPFSVSVSASTNNKPSVLPSAISELVPVNVSPPRKPYASDVEGRWQVQTMGELPLPSVRIVGRSCADCGLFVSSRICLFLHISQEGEYRGDPMQWWLGEIERQKLFSWITEWNHPVRYWGKNTNWANLVRCDASRIGCVENYCDGNKYALFCLTDKPPLKSGEVVYYWGKGACPKGSCRPPNEGCNTETGLCFVPLRPTTTTTQEPPCYKRPGGLMGLFSAFHCPEDD
ncbi:hypothetical protein Y032_0030g2184 [Ancylostoma ceylanicum]|nr:hypothetical protein Y032_0030g2184 [Ancylostoma ceylanicum]